MDSRFLEEDEDEDEEEGEANANAPIQTMVQRCFLAGPAGFLVSPLHEWVAVPVDEQQGERSTPPKQQSRKRAQISCLVCVERPE